jgi:hypothetical protein
MGVVLVLLRLARIKVHRLQQPSAIPRASSSCANSRRAKKTCEEVRDVIVTTGQIIKVEVSAGGKRFLLERSSETPGLVTVRGLGPDNLSQRLDLYAHDDSVEVFVKAFRRVCEEEIGYRTMESE